MLPRPDRGLELESLNQTSKRVASLPKSGQVQIRSVHFGGLDVHSPDLTLFVLENKSNPAESQLIINSPYLQPAVHQFFSPQDLSHRLESMYRRFARLGGRGPTVKGGADEVIADSAQDLMRGFGRLLYEKYAPPAFREAFWQLADRLGSQFATIQIYSNNPVLPWELMCPARPGQVEERTFLGLEFNIGRWHISEGTYQLERPPQYISLRKLIVIAPEYSGDQTLPAQAMEIRALESIKGYQRLPGQIQDVRILFQDFPQGIIHFAGHGMIKMSPERIPEYYISLEDGALDVMTWRGMINKR